MGISLDHVGLNTLITDSASFSTNTLGFDLISSTSSYVNTRIATIQGSNTADSTTVAGGVYAEYLVGLNTKRNGPYGYSTWKQIRGIDNPISRYHKKNSDLTFFVQPGDLFSDSDGALVGRDSRSSLYRFEEPVVTSKTRPLIWTLGTWTTVTVPAPGGAVPVVIPELFQVKSSVGVNDIYFSNFTANQLLLSPAQADASLVPSTEYQEITSMYLNGVIESPGSPIDFFDSLRYSETIYPKARNMYRKETRTRPSYKSFFRASRNLRTVGFDTSSFGFVTTVIDEITGDHERQTISQSTWPLDPSKDFLTRTLPTDYYQSENGNYDEHQFLTLYDPKGVSGKDTLFTTKTFSSGGAGILCNNYSQLVMKHPISAGCHLPPDALDAVLGIAPYYSRRHTLGNTQSVSNPTGMLIPETGGLSKCSFGTGTALWEAGTSAGSYSYTSIPPWLSGQPAGSMTRTFNIKSKVPVEDSYDEFAKKIKLKGQNYSILPEFRISNHVEAYSLAGPTHIPTTMLEVTGGGDNYDSSFEDFYITYSHSDFMRRFDLIASDHANFAPNQTLTLRCKVIKKFLPYEGFYPCQRTAQMAQMFHASYLDNVQGTWGIGNFGWGDGLIINPGAGAAVFNALPNVLASNWMKQYLLTPLFAPGVLFNTIKSGVACDYPILTTLPSITSFSGSTSASPADYLLTNTFSTPDRVPFEALLEPEAYLANKFLVGMEPHLSGNFKSACIWNGGAGGTLYKKMAQNFLSEVPEFFLKNRSFTRYVSKRQGDPAFGIQEKDKVYGMRISMYRSMAGQVVSSVSSSDGNEIEYVVPQDLLTGDTRETMTMYSRPTAFGPGTVGFTTLSSSHFANFESDRTDNVMEGYHINRSDAFKFYKLDEDGARSKILYERDSRHGYNYPFTPPYYHGQAWIDIFYTGSSDSTNATVGEILNSISASCIRFDPEFIYPPGQLRVEKGAQALYRINENAMQLSASVLFRGSAQIPGVDGARTNIGNITVTTDPASDNRWVIQTKFETPILNFNHITANTSSGNAVYDDLLTLPVHGSESVPRGMWHQYGRIPSSTEGVFLNVGPIPQAWMAVHHPQNASTAIPWTSENNLAELVGFQQEQKKLGQLADSKVIGEAIVAVPFLLNGQVKEFLALDSALVRGYIDNVEISGEFAPTLSNTIKDQINKMRKYVFPPTFDFISNPTVGPFAMYIFEFEHVLTKEDLKDIWQNLPPEIGITFETSEVSITHPLLSSEFLGGGINANSVSGKQPHSMQSQLRWMVFKVKRRATSNYFAKIIARNSTAAFPRPPEPLSRANLQSPPPSQAPPFFAAASPAGPTAAQQAFGLGSVAQPTAQPASSGLAMNLGATTAGAALPEDMAIAQEDPFQYNWPYDYFSLIELASIDAEVLFQPDAPVVAATTSEDQDDELPEDAFGDQSNVYETGDDYPEPFEAQAAGTISLPEEEFNPSDCPNDWGELGCRAYRSDMARWNRLYGGLPANTSDAPSGFGGSPLPHPADGNNLIGEVQTSHGYSIDRTTATYQAVGMSYQEAASKLVRFTMHWNDVHVTRGGASYTIPRVTISRFLGSVEEWTTAKNHYYSVRYNYYRNNAGQSHNKSEQYAAQDKAARFIEGYNDVGVLERNIYDGIGFMQGVKLSYLPGDPP